MNAHRIDTVHMTLDNASNVSHRDENGVDQDFEFRVQTFVAEIRLRLTELAISVNPKREHKLDIQYDEGNIDAISEILKGAALRFKISLKQ